MLSISASPVGAGSNNHCKLSDEELLDVGFIKQVLCVSLSIRSVKVYPWHTDKADVLLLVTLDFVGGAANSPTVPADSDCPAVPADSTRAGLRVRKPMMLGEGIPV